MDLCCRDGNASLCYGVVLPVMAGFHAGPPNGVFALWKRAFALLVAYSAEREVLPNTDGNLCFSSNWGPRGRGPCRSRWLWSIQVFAGISVDCRRDHRHDALAKFVRSRPPRRSPQDVVLDVVCRRASWNVGSRRNRPGGRTIPAQLASGNAQARSIRANSLSAQHG